MNYYVNIEIRKVNVSRSFSVSYKRKFLGRQPEHYSKTVENLDGEGGIGAQTKESVI